eukprot:gnl/TRDRNA2_/TRDRNA2_94216_c0_seq1.p1 gnl/TRDRNA2_/TRDRNA2_94216_c0~~gnl/TRDRNA2_/TRDRNA2_94216_c0_seq1.p1  ORF type:complete len:210 (-),score=51.45 gnl/TRDRNA2_/TRDRNA2_94216_c0_seq1:111-740(-)
MATENILWCQRVDKEELSFLAANPELLKKIRAEEQAERDRKEAIAKKKADAEEKLLMTISQRGMRRLSQKGSPSKRTDKSSQLQSAGEQAMQGKQKHRSSSTSALPEVDKGSAVSGASREKRQSRARSVSGPSGNDGILLQPTIMDSVESFPLTEKHITTTRPGPNEKGQLPTFSLSKEEAPALWWPKRGAYTKYNPSFTFEEPPIKYW